MTEQHGPLNNCEQEQRKHLRLQELQGGLEGLQESEVNVFQNIGIQLLAKRR